MAHAVSATPYVGEICRFVSSHRWALGGWFSTVLRTLYL